VEMVQIEGIVVVLLVLLLIEVLYDSTILRDWRPNRWCVVELMNTTTPLIAFLLCSCRNGGIESLECGSMEWSATLHVPLP
jgi:hypothetical protein